MDYPAPLDVLKMTIFATADESDRRGFSSLPIITLIFKPLRRFEILEAREPPTVRWVTGKGIASKPPRENRYLDRRR